MKRGIVLYLNHKKMLNEKITTPQVFVDKVISSSSLLIQMDFGNIFYDGNLILTRNPDNLWRHLTHPLRHLINADPSVEEAQRVSVWV